MLFKFYIVKFRLVQLLVFRRRGPLLAVHYHLYHGGWSCLVRFTPHSSFRLSDYSPSGSLLYFFQFLGINTSAISIQLSLLMLPQ